MGCLGCILCQKQLKLWTSVSPYLGGFGGSVGSVGGEPRFGGEGRRIPISGPTVRTDG